MSFNPDLNKQAQDLIFGREAKKINHYSLSFSKVL